MTDETTGPRGSIPLPRAGWRLTICRDCGSEGIVLAYTLRRSSMTEAQCGHCGRRVSIRWGDLWTNDDGSLAFVPEGA